jgi:hypothetical protein
MDLIRAECARRGIDYAKLIESSDQSPTSTAPPVRMDGFADDPGT